MNSRIAISVLCIFYLAACDRNSEIKVYRVSKAPLEDENSEQQIAMPANAPSPSMPGGMASGAGTPPAPVPPSWQPQPLSEMRQASFLVKGANGATSDISFVSLGATAGSALENVNRWLSQLGQPPINQQKLDQIAERLPTSIGEVIVVDLTGLPAGADPAKDGRIIAAMTSTNNATLFFKIRGNADLTESQKSDFVKWVAAVCNSQSAAQQQQMAATAPAAESNPQIKWQKPSDWTEAPASAMRYASFTAGTGNDKIDISVVPLPGEGGSDMENVNRWREQLGLPPMNEAAIATQVTPVQSGNVNFSMVDIAGPNARTLAAWTRRNGYVWFFKATGPSSGIAKEKANFVKFVQSVRF